MDILFYLFFLLFSLDGAIYVYLLPRTFKLLSLRIRSLFLFLFWFRIEHMEHTLTTVMTMTTTTKIAEIMHVVYIVGLSIRLSEDTKRHFHSTDSAENCSDNQFKYIYSLYENETDLLLLFISSLIVLNKCFPNWFSVAFHCLCAAAAHTTVRPADVHREYVNSIFNHKKNSKFSLNFFELMIKSNNNDPSWANIRKEYDSWHPYGQKQICTQKKCVKLTNCRCGGFSLLATSRSYWPTFIFPH